MYHLGRCVGWRGRRRPTGAIPWSRPSPGRTRHLPHAKLAALPPPHDARPADPAGRRQRARRPPCPNHGRARSEACRDVECGTCAHSTERALVPVLCPLEPVIVLLFEHRAPHGHQDRTLLVVELFLSNAHPLLTHSHLLPTRAHFVLTGADLLLTGPHLRVTGLHLLLTGLHELSVQPSEPDSRTGGDQSSDRCDNGCGYYPAFPQLFLLPPHSGAISAP